MSNEAVERAHRLELDARVEAAIASGDLAEACAVVVRGFGPEICGFIAAFTRAEDLTQDAYSRFCEDVWRGLPAFQWKSSLRSWLYALARNACFRVRRDKKRSRLSLTEAPLAALEAQVRTQTAEHFRTEVKDAFRSLREELSEEEQEVLILRVDRGMSWREIAEVRLDAVSTNEAELKREAASCRKRFERARDRIKELAAGRGLLTPKE